MTLEESLTGKLGKDIASASDAELYRALLAYVKEKTNERPLTNGNKKLYYISAEFLVGRQLGKNLINLGIYKEVNELLEKNGKSLAKVADEEMEPSLGNGGLGRLAACFLDSIATLDLNGDGVELFCWGFKRRKWALVIARMQGFSSVRSLSRVRLLVTP